MRIGDILMSIQLSPQLDEAEIAQRIESLLVQLTLKEKVSLLSGRDLWHSNPIERLEIPSLVMTDGPNGVRATNPEFGRPAGPTTCFPTGISMGATWNTDLIERVGQVLAEETLAMGCDILLGPCVNIVRNPVGGRNFETFGEDPYLNGQIAVAWIRGLQKSGIGASLKHFACNNQETERFRASSEIDERTLREIYLPAFEIAVKAAQPWTVMCSYNRINGVYASQNNYLLNQILRNEWGFKGFVVSDWGANHTTLESVEGGLDMEMPGPTKYYGKLLSDAVYHWQIDEEIINKSARRILRVILLSGKMGPDPKQRLGSVNTQKHRVLARQVAEESITLLKNERKLLPLDLTKLKSVAVIGPNAGEGRTGGGGSSYVIPEYRVSPLEGLRARLGKQVRIEYEQGCDNYVTIPVLPKEWLSLLGGSTPGLQAEYFSNTDLSGSPVVVRVENKPDFWWFSSSPADEIPVEHFSARWTAQLVVPEEGLYTFNLGNSGIAQVWLDGERLLEGIAPNNQKYENSFEETTTQKLLHAGKKYHLLVEFRKFPGQEFAKLRLGLCHTPQVEKDLRFDRALSLAKSCDAVLVFAGNPESYETEGEDRPDLELPGRQNELISAIADANPNTIVVLNAGAPVTMPWIEKVSTIMEVYYPGMEGGHAVANVLAGDVNPSGKLTMTFPMRLADHPTFINPAVPEGRKIFYGEGIFVGYRYYDAKEVEPLFPFGHGLSYTEFEYSDLIMPAAVEMGASFNISLRIRNTGKLPGKEVVQLYIHDRQSSLPRPPKELKGFSKIFLEPGESQVVTFALNPRDLSFYHPEEMAWVSEPGEYEILIGRSSRDIRVLESFTLKE
jgi:beta-glucosidase